MEALQARSSRFPLLHTRRPLLAGAVILAVPVLALAAIGVLLATASVELPIVHHARAERHAAAAERATAARPVRHRPEAQASSSTTVATAAPALATTTAPAQAQRRPRALKRRSAVQRHAPVRRPHRSQPQARIPELTTQQVHNTSGTAHRVAGTPADGGSSGGSDGHGSGGRPEQGGPSTSGANGAWTPGGGSGSGGSGSTDSGSTDSGSTDSGSTGSGSGGDGGDSGGRNSSTADRSDIITEAGGVAAG